MSCKTAHVLAAALLTTGLLGATAASAATLHSDGTHLAGVICCAMR